MPAFQRTLRIRILTTLLCLTFLVSFSFPTARATYENTHQNTGDQAADLAAVALTQLGYMDGANGVEEYTKYGAWYGIPTGYWCAMFVSWCARQANVPKSVLPSFANCNQGMRTFKKMGVWQEGPYYGGTYTPKLGDLVFYDWHGSGNSNHVGIVLYGENGYLYTVEGNTVVNRLDREDRFTPGSSGSDTDPDYALVRAHRLDSVFIRGYATPQYAGAGNANAPLQGYVDLIPGSQAALDSREVLTLGLMSPTSSHTFSPLYGITRGAYMDALARFLGLEEIGPDTEPFADLPQNHPCYQGVMALRSAGIVNGGSDGLVHPDRYITPWAAETLLGAAYARFTAELPALSYRYDQGYLQRQEAAHMLCLLNSHAARPVYATCPVRWDGGNAALDVMVVQGKVYVPLDGWREFLPVPMQKEALSGQQAPSAGEGAPAAEDDPEPDGPESFFWNGGRWAALDDLAACLAMAVDWEGETGTLLLSAAAAGQGPT